MLCRMACLPAMVMLMVLSCTSALALDKQSFRRKPVSVVSNESHLENPSQTFISRLLHNSSRRSHGAEAAERARVLCYLQTLVDPSKVLSLTQPGLSLWSAMKERGWAHQKCAVVSSSGILASHAHGKRIDQAELVFRFNDAPLRGYEELVGYKDMVRLENMHWAQRVLLGELEADPKVIYVYVLHGGAPHAPAWANLSKQRPDLQLFQVPGQMVQNVEVGLRTLFDVKVKGPGYHSVLPTSGAMGMILSISICSKVEAFGMAMSEKAVQLKGNVAYHYYEDGGEAAGNTWHESFTAEKHLWRYLGNDPLLVDTQEISTMDVAEAECSR
mmetsp:Transcript_13828/g.25374  ORF Transcript_13828/g.25374 Transcript_13828/m.25374 type:complete len:329 (-) Transcript_13828:29-1015(-)